MPEFPKSDERDRHVDPVSDFPMDEAYNHDITLNPDDENNEQTELDVDEKDDGSADVTFAEDMPDEESNFEVNLAELFDENALHILGADLVELVGHDQESRKRRDEQYEEGMRRTGLGNEAPGGADFHGASRAVHPMMAEACVDFASRAIKELFPPSGPVRTAIYGKEDEAKIDLATRKASYLNWQTTTQIREYRSELEQMLTQLPMGGSQYQKFWYDSRFNRPRTEFVAIDDVFLPYSATDFYTSPRVTHVQHITKQELNSRVEEGLYRDVVNTDISPEAPEGSATSVANEKIEGKESDPYNDDGLRDVYEIYTYQSFDQDDVTGGKSAPYIVTVDLYTEEVLSVYRNWEPHDPKFEKLDWMVEWKFIPWRGAYAIGFPHLIGGLSGAATGALRALLDSAHINNSQTLVKLRGGKVSGQNLEVEATQIAEIEGPAGTDDIRKVLMSMPYNPPSAVLFQLLGWLTDAGKSVVATAEDSMSNIGDRTPVGTTMAVMEQGSQTYSAIHARLHYSQAKALNILCRINRTFMDDHVTVAELGDLTISREEFNHSNDVIPVSDPNIFSESQRFAQMQGAAQVVQMFPQEQWNLNALARSMLHRLRLPNVDELLPEPPKPQNMNPSAENIAAMHGQPIIALPKQNHMAHIWAHIEFCTSPVIANPMFGTQIMQNMIRHIGEHVGFHYADLMNQYTHFDQVAGQTPTKQMEDTIAKQNTQVLMKLNMDMQPIMPKLQQIQQMAQQFAPQPQQDPAIKATYDVAMAEVNRKAEYDKQQIQLERDHKITLTQQLESSKQQVEMAKNLRDNTQKHITELAKNQGDNQTAQWVAALTANNSQAMAMIESKLQQEEAQLARDHDFDMTAFTQTSGDTGTGGQPFAAQPTAQPDPAAQPEQAQADPRVDDIIQHLQNLHQHLSAPKRVIRDPQGRAIGIHSDAPPMLKPPVRPKPKSPAGSAGAKQNPNDAKLEAAMQAIQSLHKHLTAPKRVVRGPDGSITGVQPIIPSEVDDGSVQ